MTEEAAQNQDEDQPVIRTLRKKVRELEKELKSAPTREQIEEEIRTDIQRETATKSHIKALGFPEKMLSKLELPEGDLTREDVADAIQEQLGLEPNATPSTQPEAGPTSQSQPTEQQQDLQRVSDLSSRVRAVADGGADPTQALSKKINSAQTPEELAELMASEGLAQSTY